MIWNFWLRYCKLQVIIVKRHILHVQLICASIIMYTYNIEVYV